MTFEDFKKEIEIKLGSITAFELQEFHFQPYVFGSGLLAFRINRLNHKFVYDGRENILIWYVSRPHQKYDEADFEEVKRMNGLELSSSELENVIKTQ